MIFALVFYAAACSAVIGYRWAGWLGAFYGAVLGPLGALMAWCTSRRTEEEQPATESPARVRDDVVRGHAPRRR